MVVLPPMPPRGPCALVGGACAPSCLRGWRGGRRPRQRRGGWQALARAGAHVLAQGQYRVPVTEHQVWAAAGRAASGARAWSASGARREGVRRGPVAAARATGSARPTTGASRSRSVGQGPVVARAFHPCLWRPVAASAHGPRLMRYPAARVMPTGVAAVGHREAWAPASGPQPPNKGVQATANSLRSCLAAALGGA